MAHNSAEKSISRFFESEFFKLVLAPTVTLKDDPDRDRSDGLHHPHTYTHKPTVGHGQSQPNPTPLDARVTQQFATALYVHKTLLASLSTELEKHTYNNMKEGNEGVMVLHDVDEATVKRFLEWAYTREYTIPTDIPPAAGVPLHVAVYVLAERFNVVALKELSFSKMTAELLEVDPQVDIGSSEADRIIFACQHAFENLPTDGRFQSKTADNPFSIPEPTLGGGSPSKHEGGGGKSNSTNTNANVVSMSAIQPDVLGYLAQYIAWRLDVFRRNPNFDLLINDNGDFARAVIHACLSAATPPWVPLPVSLPHTHSSSSSSTSSSSSSHTLPVKKNSEHILLRRCDTCDYVGVIIQACSLCKKKDPDLAIELDNGKVIYSPQGMRRLAGNAYLYTYTCRWCEGAAEYERDHRFAFCRRCGADASSKHFYPPVGTW